MFLRVKVLQVDWNGFWKWCKGMRYIHFVLCLNWICRNRWGMMIDILEQKVEFDVERLSRRILDDIFASNDCMTAGMSYLIELWVKSYGLFHNSWKHKELCQMSACGTLVRLWWGDCSERIPKL
ncbi:hypothetical protein DWZ47_10695 [Bacteroides sp. AF32-8BH]|nr:hypothetical protein DWZ47_10695 [Bacteroides sp. AF32-8BH]